MDEHHNLKEALRNSLFDEPVDLYHYNPIQSPSSFSRMVQASRSVPGSRRNSHDDNSLDLLLGKKLSLNDRESSSFGGRKLPFAMTPIEPPATNNRKSLVLDNYSVGPIGTPKRQSLILNELDASPLFNPLSTTTTTANDEMFTMTHVLEPESEPRRYSFGWHSDTNNKSPSTSNRLTSSHSFTDLSSLNFKKEVPCPNHQEFGFCSRQNICPFIHPPHNAFFYNSPPILPLNNNKVKRFDLLSTQRHQQQQQQQQDRFTNAKVEDFIGKLYELCKDQNGCRFLQRKIEGTSEEVRKNLQYIFNEILEHYVELMTDPFGNYLCQKLLEKCNDEQRTAIIKIVAPELVHIALNMHGTRAVQRLIEYLSTPEQIKMVTISLNPNVVTLIKDLNGNHVIQKCLHRLSPENNQFIYDAVCQHCIEVASHKHGCCVLQRCFDHAIVAQKDQLVNEIAKHALPLVQNPFGNYVVQYVLELGVVKYSESIIARFVNHVYILSIQKFSSNVIENCIRTAQPETRRLLIAELVNPIIMEKLLHDSFANYVIQTSLDFADEDQRIQLVECIKPLLPSIRTTPYGKRIHSKIFRENTVFHN